MISVLIPTHNRADLLLSRALPSVLAQTYKDIEIWVLAHGCTDATTVGVNAFMACDHRIKLAEVPRDVHYPDTPENRWFAGPVDPLNVGLDLARGDWIARMDDDDIWRPNHLEKLLAFAEAGDYEFVSSAHKTHEGKVAPYDFDGTLVGGCQTWLYKRYLKCFKYDRDCWKKDHNRVNDTDLQDRMHKAGVKMGYLDEVTCLVLPRPGETEVGYRAIA